jgi:hypothetical protein
MFVSSVKHYCNLVKLGCNWITLHPKTLVVCRLDLLTGECNIYKDKTQSIEIFIELLAECYPGRQWIPHWSFNGFIGNVTYFHIVLVTFTSLWINTSDKQLKAGSIYFTSWFQNVESIIAWSNGPGKNTMVTGVCGTEEILHLMVNREQREQEKRRGRGQNVS